MSRFFDMIKIWKHLLRYPDVAKEYAKLKQGLAKQYPDDRRAYSKGKDTFIKSIIDKAEKELGDRIGN